MDPPDPPDLPPEVRRERRRVEALAGGFVGLSSDDAAVRARELDVPLRLLHPGDMMTADFRPTRVNGELGDAGTVSRTWLG